MNYFPQENNPAWHGLNHPTPEELRLVEAHEFLPRMSRWTHIGVVVLLASLLMGVGLASILKYNVAVKVAATVRPQGELGVVHAPVLATVERIQVRENELVNRGEPIVYLDDSRLQAQKSQLQSSIDQIKLQIGQVDAQLREITVQIAAQTRLINRSIGAALAELRATERQYADEQVRTRADLTQARVGWNLAKAQRDRLEKDHLLSATIQEAEAGLNLAQLQRDRLESALTSGAVPRQLWEEKQQAVKSAAAKLEQVKANAQNLREEKQQAREIAAINLQKAQTGINPSQAAVTVASERVKQEQARGEVALATLARERKSLLQQKLELQKQVTLTEEQLQQLETELSQTVIRAPITGTLLQLNLRNPGQVVQPSEAIAQIAPLNAPILVKAVIPAEDIDKVKPGQQVQMRVSACPYTDYGTLKGSVINVTPDALPIAQGGVDKNGARAVGYEATIQPQTVYVGNSHRACFLQPGMTGRADIISRQETILDFILRKARLITPV